MCSKWRLLRWNLWNRNSLTWSALARNDIDTETCRQIWPGTDLLWKMIFGFIPPRNNIERSKVDTELPWLDFLAARWFCVDAVPVGVIPSSSCVEVVPCQCYSFLCLFRDILFIIYGPKSSLSMDFHVTKKYFQYENISLPASVGVRISMQSSRQGTLVTKCVG